MERYHRYATWCKNTRNFSGPLERCCIRKVSIDRARIEEIELAVFVGQRRIIARSCNFREFHVLLTKFHEVRVYVATVEASEIQNRTEATMVDSNVVGRSHQHRRSLTAKRLATAFTQVEFTLFMAQFALGCMTI